MNGVISAPATHSWGSLDGNQKALENDMEIKSVTFSDSRGILSPDEYYFMAGQSINVSVDIGFEDISGIESFYEGEGLVNFYNGDFVVANTTKLDEDFLEFFHNSSIHQRNPRLENRVNSIRRIRCYNCCKLYKAVFFRCSLTKDY